MLYIVSPAASLPHTFVVHPCFCLAACVPLDHHQTLANLWLSCTLHLPLHLQLFITTEDPRTLAYFTNSSRWLTSYTYMKEEESGGRDDTEYLRSLLNLDLSLQCDGFAGSFFSNWQRLIVEMRVTVRCRANAVYVDAHYKTPAEMDFNW
eukprot:GHRQ01021569.1.p1 GENE.GHRQ01021569.1~~GHRQ01021569.1.p1  ORF type:complete len:150 (-),score=25.84 GHRQ01021569.1:688-1137(-)